MSFWRDQRVVVTGGTGFRRPPARRPIAERWLRRGHGPRPRRLRSAAGGRGGAPLSRHRRRRWSSTSPPWWAASAPTATPAVLLRQPDDGRCTDRARAARRRGKFVTSAPSAPIPSSPRCRSARRTSGTATPEETNAPYGLAKKMLLVQSQAYRQQYGFDSSSCSGNLYGPRDNFDPRSSHVIPALIRKCVRRGRGARRSRCGATAPPPASSSTLTTPPRRSSWPPNATTAAEPVNLGTGREISIATGRAHRRVTGFRGDDRVGPSKPDGQPRRCLDTSRARGVSASAPRPTFARGCGGRSNGYRNATRAGRRDVPAPTAAT